MFADPEKILKNFGIADTMIVADFGAGSGFYSIPAAKMAQNGKVYAIEIQKDFLTTLKDKAEKENVGNIEILWADIEKSAGTRLNDSIVDVVILSNILFQAVHKEKVLEEAYRILKNGGRVLFIDWSEVSTFSPRKENLIMPTVAREMFKAQKFVYDKDIDAGEHHYGMIFRKI